ncbi:Crp/Fnr family transcriptional regulator [Ferruginibacter albus]|uniref:Crp/Fnr family transcriptional regulator n=1 Tax=Ferruginibacter albus TaxID=2875540 RepID=UPI001CC6B7EA|nr:Crp/Fnr family transcriptional regulator [Ferruginibacter albus]UAY51220.1 Crp/Fnr family transcriptional regulator [Ferruginibacter albus]
MALRNNLIHISSVINKWDTKKGPSPLSKFLKMVHPEMDEAPLKYVDEHCFTYNVKKGTLLLREGEICEHLFLILKGAVRGYIRDENKEIITWITLENEMVTSIRGMYKQEPSLEYIEAIEDCELVGATFQDLHYLYDNFKDMNIAGRRLLEKYCMDADARAEIGRLSNATTRYKRFLETQSQLANRVPLTYIASYLGITLETLSRIRNKMAK